MFVRTVIRHKTSKFALFMKESKSHAALKGLGVPARGVMLGKLYRALTPEQVAALEKRAAKVTFKRPKTYKPRDPNAPKRKPSDYNKFVARTIRTLKGPLGDRIKKVAQLWVARTTAVTKKATTSATKTTKK